MANRQGESNSPAQPGDHDHDRNPDLNEDRVRGIGDTDAGDATEDEEFEDADDLDDEEEEGEGSF